MAFPQAPILNSNTINVFAYPKQFLGAVTSDEHENVTGRIAQMTFEKLADGGDHTASITLRGLEDYLWNWFESGLGKDIRIMTVDGETLWRGFVNRIVFNRGQQAMITGPFLNIANRVKVIYTPILDITVVPATLGSVAETTYAEDTDSQAKWGIHERLINGGNLVDDATVGGSYNQAEQLRDRYLDDYSAPPSSHEVSIGSNIVPGVLLECMGYAAFMSMYTYADDTLGYVQADNRMTDLPTQDPNNFLVAGTIETNALLVVAYEYNRTAWEIANEITSLGDASLNRWLFSVSGNGELNFIQAPDEVEYVAYQGQIYNPALQRIDPWRVKPGKWLYMPKSLVAPPAGPVDPDSPFYSFLESVRYTIPYQIQLNGAKILSVAQLLAQFGIEG